MESLINSQDDIPVPTQQQGQIQEQPQSQIPPSLPLELFLINLKLFRDYYSFYKLKGVSTLEEAFQFRKFPSKQSQAEEKKMKFLLANIRAIRDELPKDPQEQIVYLINKHSVFEDGIELTTDSLVKSFKNSTKLPDVCLPSKLQSHNLKASSLYSATMIKKRISIVSIKEPFRNLKHLYLNDNYIQKMENFPFPNLEMLELSGNYIRKIENLSQMPNLKKINLSNNIIYILEGLENNPTLEEIDLSNQYIPKFINFAIRPNSAHPQNKLLSANLEGCNVMNPEELKQFPWLCDINLKSNSIFDMMSVLSVCKACPYLQRINVLNNPFTIENKTTYRNFIIIACDKITSIDDKDVKDNEKIYVHNLFSRKYGNKPKVNAKKRQEGFGGDAIQITHLTNNQQNIYNKNYNNYYYK